MLEKFDLLDVERPWETPTPSSYDSQDAKRLTEQWGKWLGRQADSLQLYDIRHAWAIRAIHSIPNASLAAKCMGHSVEVHHKAYHRWLAEADVAQFAATLRFGQSEGRYA
jgi:hypothetical protein